MINIYTAKDLLGMRKAGTLAKKVLEYVEQFVVVGVSTEELNNICHQYIIDHNAIPAPLNYRGFPKSICTSVNNVICHGIPDIYKLRIGDIINIDITVIVDGYYGDTSATFLIGKCSKLAETLIEVTKAALWRGIEAVKPFRYFSDIGKSIQNYVQEYGFSIVRDFCGHGIGKSFHEEPCIAHYKEENQGPQILPGMFFTIEPMINVGSHKTKLAKDGWTATTIDQSLSAQFEHTLAVFETGVEVLTG